MSPMPVQMRDRWASRVEPPEGKGTVYWHVLLGGHPEVRAAAAEARKRLRAFHGLHFTPEQWLHMTLMVVGSTDDIDSGQLDEIQRNVDAAVSGIDPIAISLDRVLYHPEAIMLACEPASQLRHLQELVWKASRCALTGIDEVSPRDWVPHITVAYSVAGQPAAPITSAVGRSISEQRFPLTSLALVTQWGPERRWVWEPTHVVQLSSVST